MYINTYTHRSEAYRFKLKAVHKFTFFQALCVGAMARVWWVFLPEVGGWMTVSGDEERGDRFSTTCGRRFSYSLQFKGSHTHYAFIVNRSKTAAWPIFYTLIQGEVFSHMIKNRHLFSLGDLNVRPGSSVVILAKALKHHRAAQLHYGRPQDDSIVDVLRGHCLQIDRSYVRARDLCHQAAEKKRHVDEEFRENEKMDHITSSFQGMEISKFVFPKGALRSQSQGAGNADTFPKGALRDTTNLPSPEQAVLKKRKLNA